ncbi:polysaccharide lyase 6 family protein [Ferrimonas senticii]|uniref:polysaccharide lyase 6 family protein n=1 Tax=Ferrimonas senticii TaxID=394566 RepID=UPI000421D91F|nr:polysaccharide lyase 6 family protein [Ferrimonas senticii]
MLKKSLNIAIFMLLFGCGSDKNNADSPGQIPPPVTPPPVSEPIDFGLPEKVLTVPEVNCTVVYETPDELERAATTELPAGTTLCLADGTYNESLELRFGGQGSEENPIVIAAENSGKVIFNGGEITIHMGGEHSRFQGFIFNNVNYTDSLISTRLATHNLCKNCRITEVSIINAKATKEYGILVHLYGDGNWLDHSVISGKESKNPMISFNRWVDKDWDEATKENELAKNIIVYRNYIANRAPTGNKLYPSNDDNDYEAIRTGLSDTHQYRGDSFIVGNLFEGIQGEAEVISNKASHNVIAGNTIRNSFGSLTNRHGNSNQISNNFILSDDYPFSGGIRIVDDGHTVTNNYIEGARYLNSSHHGGIVILGSDGAGDGSNGYQQTENVHIAFNTVVDSVNSLNIDGGDKSRQPKNIFLANNLIDHAIGAAVVGTERGISPDSNVSNNIVFGQMFSDTDEISQGGPEFHFTSAGLQLEKDDNLYRPKPDLELLTTDHDYEKGNFDAVSIDMDGQQRGELTYVGADDSQALPSQLKPLNYPDVGPVSYRVPKPQPIIAVSNIANAAFDNELEQWQANGAELVHDNDAFSRNSSVMLTGSSTLSQIVTLESQRRYAISAFAKGNYQIKIGEVATLAGSSSNYQWSATEFDSTIDGEVTLQLCLPEKINATVPVADHNFAEFKANKGSSNVWITDEDSDNGLGDVGSSGDSAFSDQPENASARIRFKKTSINHDFESKPGLSQLVSNVPQNTDITLSLYICDSKGPDSLTTVQVTATGNDGQLLAKADFHAADIENNPSGSVKDCFKQVKLPFNSGSNQQVTIGAHLIVDTKNYSSEEILTHEQFTNDELQVRLDHFVLEHQQPTPEDAKAYFDDIRLVSRLIE